MDCYFRALSLLARTEHCRRGLQLKLTARGYEKQEIQEALDRLSAEGHLDDRRYAALWADFRLRRKREGRRLLMAGLIKRGVNRELAAEVVRELASGDTYKTALQEGYQKIRRDRISRRVEVYSLLYRKGFSSADIQNFLESIDEVLY